MINARDLPRKTSPYELPAVPHGQHPTEEQLEQAMTSQIANIVMGVAVAKMSLKDATTNQIVALLKSADLATEAGIKAFAKIAATLVRLASRKAQEVTWAGVKRRTSIAGVPFTGVIPKVSEIPKHLAQGRTSNLEQAYARLAKEYRDNLKRTVDDPVIRELISQHESEGISPLVRPEDISTDVIPREGDSDGQADWAESFFQASATKSESDSKGKSDKKKQGDSLAERRRRAREKQAEELEKFNASVNASREQRERDQREIDLRYERIAAENEARRAREEAEFNLGVAEIEALIERYALQKAGERAERMVGQDISGASRNIYSIAIDSIPDNAVIGYRRVVHPELSKNGVSCGLCIVASTMEYRKSDLLPIHSGCNCEVCEIYSKDGKLYDPGHIINMEDLEVFYREAGNSTHGWDLKKGRYKVVNHPEYGPTLVNAHPNKTGKIKKEHVPANGQY